MKLKIGIVSAEPSGDLLASKLIENLKEKFNEVELIGVGSGPLGKYKINQDRKDNYNLTIVVTRYPKDTVACNRVLDNILSDPYRTEVLLKS